ncbi:MAG: ribokinase, partial [Planctomycetes bacterium]|nr:ribokinase [Planctomycetota bacterium]
MSVAMKPLLVLGSANADLYVEVERLPASGETILGRNAAMRPGGKGANQAAAAARLGCDTAFAGQVGDDAYGPRLRAELSASGVKLDLLASVSGASGQAFIILQGGGENSIIVVPGANAAWSRPSQAVVSRIPLGGALLLQREIPDSVNLVAAQAAHGAG